VYPFHFGGPVNCLGNNQPVDTPPIFLNTTFDHISKSPPTPPDEENSAYSLSFETWWKQYPRKIAKDDAFKAWQKIGKTNTTTVQQLIQAIQKQVEGKHFRGRDGQDYVPNPATWLNQGRWKDEIKEHIHKGEEYVV